MRAVLVLLAALLAMTIRPTAAAEVVGFTTLQVPWSRTRPPIPLGLWYPADGAPSEQALGSMRQRVVPDGPVRPGRHRLVVIAHGAGGWLGSHLDTALALASAGFVVAAPTFDGDNFADRSRVSDVAALAAQLHAVISATLEQWPGGAGIDRDDIGAFGFSSGGFAVLVSAGATPDLSRVAPFCARQPANYTCRLRDRYPADARQTGWIQDTRLGAIAIAAPALGFTFGPGAMAGVRGPVSLWIADADRIVPPADGAEPVGQALRGAGVAVAIHHVPDADHWDFLAPCTAELARIAAPICAEPAGFDRAAFHRAFDDALVDFFRATPGRARP